MTLKYSDQKFKRLIRAVVEFSILDFAKRYAERSEKPVVILKGDREKFWVVPDKDADELIARGYEIIDQD